MEESTYVGIVWCCEAIMERTKESPEEGILRVPGKHNKWRRAVADILRHPNRTKEILTSCSLHDISSILKELLREVQAQCGSLFTEDGYETFSSAKEVGAVRKGVKSLPERNKKALHKISQMIAVICKNSETRMTPATCAMVLSPNLVLNKGSEEEIFQRCLSNNMKDLFEVLASHTSEVFESDEKR
eukprot:CAMPEP_0114492824 /NCGR_PEP_ID=MMETSP0109-20121206/3767_1 /TAXON_ID=29199 /ORGANISM="Chlorarachnion reptans, Strain CCCM449" /LENGTH=186 /DNA_ID=CAMNT_0001669705 /DNA_START=278 /DNA_END=838 /DNA_ORIENTATION=-